MGRKHEERNDALKRKNRIALQRYNFAIECLDTPRRVLDLGCGMGYGVHLLNDAGHFASGYDYSEEAVEAAKADYNGSFEVKNLNEGEFESEVVVCLETLCHLDDPEDFISRIKSEYLIVSAPIDPNPDDGYHFRKHNLSEEQFKSYFEDWEILKELRQEKYMVLYLQKI